MTLSEIEQLAATNHINNTWAERVRAQEAYNWQRGKVWREKYNAQ